MIPCIHSRVLIDLLDENDNAPIIDTYPYEMLPELNTVKILLNESLSINSLVLSLSIIDRDSGDNGRVTWKLNQSSIASPFELIRLTENTGELRTKYRLDREHLSEYRLTLDATDHGRPIPKSTRLNLLIIVLDENDNAPRFAQTMINATISEHVKISRSDGYEVFHLRADDADQGLNREISFSIIKQEKNLFQIDSKTGIIRAMVEFDRQQQETYIVHVEARDQGQWSNTSLSLILIQKAMLLQVHPRYPLMPRSPSRWFLGMNILLYAIQRIHAWHGQSWRIVYEEPCWGRFSVGMMTRMNPMDRWVSMSIGLPRKTMIVAIEHDRSFRSRFEHWPTEHRR